MVECFVFLRPLGPPTFGIIAAIAIPNLLNAINRGRQKRTMADIRSIATAVEAYSVDNSFYPRLGSSATLEASGVINYIEPTYIRRAPRNDGWGSPFGWIGTTAGTDYSIWSAGSDKNATIVACVDAQTTFQADIIYSNGSFLCWPEGMQTGA